MGQRGCAPGKTGWCLRGRCRPRALTQTPPARGHGTRARQGRPPRPSSSSPHSCCLPAGVNGTLGVASPLRPGQRHLLCGAQESSWTQQNQHGIASLPVVALQTAGRSPGAVFCQPSFQPRTHGSDGGGGRPHEGNAAVLASLGKVCVLRQEAVAGVDRCCPGCMRHLRCHRILGSLVLFSILWSTGSWWLHAGTPRCHECHASDSVRMHAGTQPDSTATECHAPAARASAASALHLEDAVCPEVAVPSRGRADAEGLIGVLHVQRTPIRFAVDCNSGDAQAPGCGEHAAGNLPSVCHQQLANGHALSRGPGTSRGRAERSRLLRCPHLGPLVPACRCSCWADAGMLACHCMACAGPCCRPASTPQYAHNQGRHSG